MSNGTFNPYQPPPATAPSDVEEHPDAVSFFTTESNMRFAESHFVLRVHPMRLVVVSLLLIAASSLAMVGSLAVGMTAFAGASVVSLVVSAVVYLGSVYRSKLKMRRQWNDYGLQPGTISSLEVQDSNLILSSPTGIHQWSVDSTRTYLTRKGMMVSPEPLLCIFVPKKNQSSADKYLELQSDLGR